MKAPALSTSVGNVGSTSVGVMDTTPAPSSLNGACNSNANNKNNNNDEANDNNWQQEMLMERLRTKASSLRPLHESTKSLRQFILNKQHLQDSTDRNSMSICLDELQQNIPVTSLEAMIERLKAIARQLGLKFTVSTSTKTVCEEVYISCEMFYVEVLLNKDGTTRDVRVEFAGKSANTDIVDPVETCPELINCLTSCDFKEFTAHLQGFLAMYTLNTTVKKAKLQTQYALKALETDLTTLFALAEESLSDPYKLVLKSPVGLLLPRRGGHSMRLVYFISPYELLDVSSGQSVSLTSNTLRSTEFGQHAQLHIIASSAHHKLQHSTLIQVSKGHDGKKLFAELNALNSITVQSVFCLKLPKPLPISFALARRIADITGITLQDITGVDITEAAALSTGNSYGQLVDLVVLQASEGKLNPTSLDKGLYVTLPDQQHCYYFSTQGCNFPGMLLTNIPFTHPSHITSILMILRAQAAFNTLISSCVRPYSKQDADSAYMFEVTSLSHEFISVTFEHPHDDSTATAEIDLSDLSNVRCRLHTLALDPTPGGAGANFCSDEFATKVLQRCLSIPVTMRAVMRKATKEEVKEVLPQCGDSVVMSSMSSGAPPSDLNQNNKFLVNELERRGAAAVMRGGGGGSGAIGVVGQPMQRSNTASNVAGQRPPLMSSQQQRPASAASISGAPNITPGAVNTNAANMMAGNYPAGKQQNMNFFHNSTFPHVKQEPGLEKSLSALPIATQKISGSQQHHFLEDVKAVKVRKRKVLENDRRANSQYGEDVIEVDDPTKDPLDISDVKPDVEKLLAYGMEPSRRKMDKPPPSYESSTDNRNRRDSKMEKLQNFLAKRRASNDSNASTASSSASSSNANAGSCDLAALREKVYGAGSAATFAQFNLVPSDDHITPDGRDITKKSKKIRTNEPQVVENRKSPIFLDLTESESASKKSSSSSGRSSSSGGSSSSSSSSSSANSASLLKRPGIEIFPIPGSTAPISIPSSITVTPVIKSASSSSLSYSSEDKYRDKKDKRDRKDSEKKDKKRRREDSPSSSKSSKVQVMSNSMKHSSSSSSSSLSSMDKFRSESSKSSSSISSVSVKPSTPPYQSPSKSSKVPSSPSLSKSSSSQHSSSKLSYSPTSKSSSSSSSSKTIYSPSQSQHHSSSPKNTSSPKQQQQQGLSPKHSSSGKPNLNTLKSNTSPSSFPKSSLSPKNSYGSNSSSSSNNNSSSKLTSTGSTSSSSTSSSTSSNYNAYASSKDRISSSSPARSTQVTSNSSSVTSALSSSSVSNSSSKSKSSQPSSTTNLSSSEKTKTTSSDQSVPKLPVSSSSSTQPFFLANNPTVANALQDKSSFLLDKGKASPPKNRKGLNDIVDKLRAGVTGTSDAICIGDTSNDKKDITKLGGVNDPKKDPDKKNDYTLKPLDGLKLSFNKSKAKELKENQAKSPNLSSNSQSSKSSKSVSGLKPGVSSGPASKKVSMSSLPPIPKLNSSTNVNTTVSISPLASPLSSSTSASAASYNSANSSQSYAFSSHHKDRSKDKSSSSSSSSHDRSSSSSDRSKSKDSSKSSSDLRRESSSSDKYSSSSSNSSSSCSSTTSTVTSSASRNKDESSSRSSSTSSSVKKSQDSDSRSIKSAYQKPDSGDKDSTIKTSSSHNDRIPDITSSSSSMLISLLSGPTSANNTKVNETKTKSSDEHETRPISSSSETNSTGISPNKLSAAHPGLPSSNACDDTKKSDHSKVRTDTNHVNASVSNSTSDSTKSSSSSSLGLSSKLPTLNNSTSSGISVPNSNNSTSTTSSSSTRAPAKPVSSSENLPPPSLPPPKTSGLHTSSTASSAPNYSHPLSPSVSIKIVKSPAPVSSPMNMISPMSMSSQHSPCIIDDDLMDEALMGPRK